MNHLMAQATEDEERWWQAYLLACSGLRVQRVLADLGSRAAQAGLARRLAREGTATLGE